jgi:hypothetical protein
MRRLREAIEQGQAAQFVQKCLDDFKANQVH